jgi:hypothetical protein
MDQGIIQCFKAHYHAEYIQRTIGHYDAGITPSKIYDIDQLEAMRLADIAWQEVDTTTIRHCWHKAGVVPTTDLPTAPAQPTIPITSLLHTASHNQDLDPIAMVEDTLRCVLDDLEETGILQRKNRMDVEALLNPLEESQTMDDTTDEEICRAVLAAHKAQEGGLISGEEDNVEDDDTPTYREVAQAVSIINKYVRRIDDPVARKVEGTLSMFRYRMRSVKAQAQVLTNTHITDYFPHA